MALPQEGRAIFGSRGWGKRDNLHYKKRIQGDNEIVIFITGQGKKKIENSLRKISNISNFSLFINLGVCGGLNPNLTPGDLISPDEILFKDRAIRIDKEIKGVFDRALLRNGLNVRGGRLLNSPEVVFDPEVKLNLFMGKGCIAVDMEAFFIGEFLGDFDLPFYCLKAVSDTANQKISRKIISILNGNGDVDYLKLIRLILLNPPQLSYLYKMGVGFKRATSSLRRAFSALEAFL